jgi:hypothetical protein
VRLMTNLTRHFVCVLRFVEHLRYDGMMRRFWRLEYIKLERCLDLFLIDWDLCWKFVRLCRPGDEYSDNGCSCHGISGPVMEHD